MQKTFQKWQEIQKLKHSIDVFEVKNRKFMFNETTCRFYEIDSPLSFLIYNIKKDSDFEVVKVEYGKRFSLAELKESIDDLSTLYSSGYITEREPPFFEKTKTSQTVCACLIMATDCNLRCKYCFASGGSYGHEHKLMSKEVAEKAVDYLIAQSGWRPKLELGFFGGEPLLNFKVIKSTVEYAKKIGYEKRKEFAFSVTTNGLLLNDEKMDFFISHNFGIIVSLDGPKDVNDKCRVDAKGIGTHDTVVARLTSLLKKYPQLKDKITIRSTFTSQTGDIARVLHYIKNLGFKNISVEPAATKNVAFTLARKDIPQIIEQYDKAAEEYLQSMRNGEDYRFFHMHQMFFQIEDGTARISQCGAGLGYISVDPDGAIFPCHRLVGDNRFVMGNVSGASLNQELIDLFSHCSVPFKDKCKSCWARYICGGGCHATAIMFNGDILLPDEIECELMKHRIKLGAWIYAEITQAKNQVRS